MPRTRFPHRRITPLKPNSHRTSFTLLSGILMAVHIQCRAVENLVIQPSSSADSPSIELRLSGSTSPGALISYVAGTDLKAMVFQVPASLDGWQWQAVDETGQDHLTMELRSDHSLALINSAGIPKIVLSPGNAVVSPAITIGNSPVLTEAAADARYVSSVLGVTQLDGSSPQTITLESSPDVGQDLTIRAGAGTGENATGGNLYLSGGKATGPLHRYGGHIFFQTPGDAVGTSTESPMMTRMYVNRYGGVGIGAGAGTGTHFEHFGGLDISWGGAPATLVLGAEGNLTTRNDLQPKYATVVVPHYRTSQYAVAAIRVAAGATENIIDIGGMNSEPVNAATQIRFWTAPNSEAGSGTLRMALHGNGAVQIGTGATASQAQAVAIGQNALASQWESAALGREANASGETSLALGAYTTATNKNAVAVGVGAQAIAANSFASGWQTVAQGYGQTVVGGFNKATGNSSNPYDPESEIFVVGNGYEEVDGQGALQVTRRNAITIKRNGNTTINGDLRVNGVLHIEPAGDILMGEFGDTP